MGFNLSFFKTPKHRVFNYQPLYYDERKEAMEERYARLHEGEKGKEREYIPGKFIRGRFRKAVYENRRGASGSVILTRIIVMVTIVILFFVAFYFAKSFGLFFSSLG